MRERAQNLPRKPGVYLFLDADENVLYVGKARDLRARVTNYFSADDKKTRQLMEKAADIDTIVTRNEVEALLLENKLINQHKPSYNVMLRDSSRYAWILVTDEEWPRIITARNKKRGGTYYGPYTDGTARRKTVVALNKAFTLRTCNKLPKRACLQYHIGNCTAPCEGKDTKEDYLQRVRDAKNVLEGNTGEIVERLEQEMRKASENKQYELAKQKRDTIKALKQLETRQVVEREESFDQDVIAHSPGEDEHVYVVLNVRRGVIAKKREYRLDTADQEEFITAYYRRHVPPRQVLTHSLSNDDQEALSEYLSEIANGRVEVHSPQRGEKKRLVELAQENATISAEQEHEALSRLQDALNLAEPPNTIDCFDASTHHGDQTVASCIRYRGGQPDPSKYRHYNIKESEHDDYAAIREAVRRRYREDEPPDLVVIDGGKGQLSAAQKALPSGTAAIGLAKQEEEVYVPGLSFPLPLDQKDAGLLLLRRIRDAAHRFAIKHHRGRRRKALTRSVLDHAPGIGPKRKQALYEHFKTFERIKNASVEELQSVLGEKTGKKLHEALSENQNKGL